MFLSLSKSGFFNTARRITTLARVKTRDCGIYNLTYPGSRHLSTITNYNLVFSYKVPSKLKYYKRLTYIISCYSEWPLLLNCGLRLTQASVPATAVTYIADTDNEPLQVYPSYPDSWSSKLWTIFDIFCTILRALVHLITFLPVMVLYPLTYLSSGFIKYWHQLLVFTLELSGPIFVKLGQWGSTRRDLFTEDLCNALAKLQTNNRPHSWYYTKKTLERAYGPNWAETFILDNDGMPVGTGCCGQVYKAWIKPSNLHCKKPLLHGGCADNDRGNALFVEIIERLGLGRFIPTIRPICVDGVENCKHLIPTAVKVLHPSMSTFLRRDLAIMKGAAKTLQWLAPDLEWLSLPDCVDEFADLMRAQVDLNIEADNLERFAANFHDISAVRFPKPIRSMTKSYLLVETFEEGEPMFDYVTGSDVSKSLKVELADIGMHMILKMVFQDNFIHGDLHPGNMLVQRKTPLSSDFWDINIFRYIRNFIVPILPALRLVVIDCGIIVSLSDRDKYLFREVFRGVADGKGRIVADLFLNNSTNKCHDPEKFRARITELVQMSIDKSVTLDQFAVASLMSQVFSTMVEYKVKMEGCFTSVVLAVMVVEGLGRSLDPSIDLVSKARPYLFKSIDIPKLLQHSKTILS